MVQDTEYYDRLQIAPDASQQEIKRAYRRLALECHPDKLIAAKSSSNSASSSSNSTSNDDGSLNHGSNNNDSGNNNEGPIDFVTVKRTQFQRVSEAYEVLSDEKRRKRYDREGLIGLEAVGDGASGDAFEEPMALFTKVFGGEGFGSLIGEYPWLVYNREKKAKEEAAEADAEDARREEEELKREAAEAEQSSNGTSSSSFSSSSSSSAAAARRKEKRHAYQQRQQQHQHPKPSSSRALVLANEPKEESPLPEWLSPEYLSRWSKDQIGLIAARLLRRLEQFTITADDPDAMTAMMDSIRLEINTLKMESFGLHMLHEIGRIYVDKGAEYIRTHTSLLGRLDGGLVAWGRETAEKVGDCCNIVKYGIGALRTMKTIGNLAEEEKKQKAAAQQEQPDDGAFTNNAGGKNKNKNDAGKSDPFSNGLPSNVPPELIEMVFGQVLCLTWNFLHLNFAYMVRRAVDEVLSGRPLSLHQRQYEQQQLREVEEQQRMIEQGEHGEGDSIDREWTFVPGETRKIPSRPPPCGASEEELVQRACALCTLGDLFIGASRSPEEMGELSMFEEMMSKTIEKNEFKFTDMLPSFLKKKMANENDEDKTKNSAFK